MNMCDQLHAVTAIFLKKFSGSYTCADLDKVAKRDLCTCRESNTSPACSQSLYWLSNSGSC